MILDTIENAKLYKDLSKRLAVGFNYLTTTDFSALEMGVYKIEGDNVFAILQTYDTKEEVDCRLESHQKYIDIQYLISGEEFIGVEPLNNQEVTEDLLTEKDVVFYNGQAANIKLSAGSFMVFYPTDVHAPGIKINQSSKVIKVVVKVAID
ncbi:YhcH/YjgK/YiaL family protein [Wenyingzhuangia heitensis]|uniref:YhcH/YjgK/YiaL family protein n=1 Tax=Wenyingzhuangia heitensis TaxID=1487859 RepID=A0ABX0U3Y8_9FLAO|nr:YhcH/YjgK/YiaL family protein [Wenyingzhuangia heitensis]NIJ43590.1 YhcH/YjgK/YiaL family protein [Wenyingzhuangia heitensis]